MYWDSINPIIQPDPLLIHASILYKIYWKDLFNLYLWPITVFVDELQYTGANSISPLDLYFLTKRLL